MLLISHQRAIDCCHNGYQDNKKTKKLDKHKNTDSISEGFLKSKKTHVS